MSVQWWVTLQTFHHSAEGDTRLHAGSNLEEGIMKKKVNALKKALGLYSSRLGLEFRQSDGEILASKFIACQCQSAGLSFC